MLILNPWRNWNFSIQTPNAFLQLSFYYYVDLRQACQTQTTLQATKAIRLMKGPQKFLNSYMQSILYKFSG